MMSFPVAKMNDPMLGIDVHDMIVPPAPAVVKFTPHPVAAKIGWVKDSADLSTNVLINNMMAAKQFHDISMLIPHIPPGPNVLMAVILPLSGSKVMLGSSTVLVNNKPIGVGPVPMLNCGDPCSLPTGVLIPLTNVFAGVSLADFLIAMATMLAEMAVSFICGEIGGKVGAKVAGAVINRAASRVSATIYSRVTAREAGMLVQRLGSEGAERAMVVVQREIGESLTVGMSRETAERASFLFTETASRETFEAAHEHVMRETVAVVTEDAGAVVAREVVSESGVHVMREGYQRTTSDAVNSMAGKTVDYLGGSDAGNAANGLIERGANSLSGVPSAP